jgi:hypothetical protein
VSRIGRGYGSEFHLLRYLGYHRHALNMAVGSVIGAGVEWYDARFSPNPSRFYYDEWKGVEFLPAGHPARLEWHNFWPKSPGSAPRWDAVGHLHWRTRDAFLLVEAKSHTGEVISQCMAKGASREQIARSLEEAKSAFGVRPECDWLSPYYQMCNRLALLAYLHRHDVRAHLLFIYFTGEETFPSGRHVVCPRSEGEWMQALHQMHQHIGWNHEGPLAAYVHRMYLPMYPSKRQS